jgi:hypothetical protein
MCKVVMYEAFIHIYIYFALRNMLYAPPLDSRAAVLRHLTGYSHINKSPSALTAPAPRVQQNLLCNARIPTPM